MLRSSERKEKRKKEIVATLQNRIQIFGKWLAAFLKGRGWDGIGLRTLRFVLDYKMSVIQNITRNVFINWPECFSITV